MGVAPGVCSPGCWSPVGLPNPTIASMKTLAACAFGIVLIALGMWYRPHDADDFGPFYRAGKPRRHSPQCLCQPLLVARNEHRRPISPVPPNPILRCRITSSIRVSSCNCLARFGLPCWCSPPLLSASRSSSSMNRTRGTGSPIALAFSFPLANALTSRAGRLFCSADRAGGYSDLSRGRVF